MEGKFCAPLGGGCRKEKTHQPRIFFDFPGLTSVLDLDLGFGCFSSRRVGRTYIYLPGLPKSPDLTNPLLLDWGHPPVRRSYLTCMDKIRPGSAKEIIPVLLGLTGNRFDSRDKYH